MELHTLTDNSTSEDKQVNILPLSFDFKYELAGKISEEAALLFLEEMTRSSIAPDACKETISFIPE
ncbi:hypothetical protein AVI51_06725 [Piscirickettsia salmonis]|nr:hypothetical protein AVI48_01925 [Piscirickettsia salmonis]ERL60624.1 hypothetical protein K661_03054 [Piscirickettsia salmonis LF-89 = ATCC VR-1361]RNC76917.1 hypothetical protein DA717_13230 [Piscirickettsiaceae bacterium NZ-RLO2]APS46602.1 hypothetical protein AVI49_02525 [Piscirickettsia salmonis]APS50579.1 hypothetical protein AVI50_06800 [Piscirickettsia salmonis]